jgi:hypothetical protein
VVIDQFDRPVGVLVGQLVVGAVDLPQLVAGVAFEPLRRWRGLDQPAARVPGQAAAGQDLLHRGGCRHGHPVTAQCVADLPGTPAVLFTQLHDAVFEVGGQLAGAA